MWQLLGDVQRNHKHNLDRKNSWTLSENNSKDELLINAKRIGDVSGEHTIIYDSVVDSIEIKHSAKSRKGFAQGAVLSAEFLKGKIGVYNMKDLLKIS